MQGQINLQTGHCLAISFDIYISY